MEHISYRYRRVYAAYAPHAQPESPHHADALAGAALTALLGALNDGVWTCDRQGRVLFCNDAALAMFGFARTDVALSTIDDIADLFVDTCPYRRSAFALRDALAGQTVERELRFHSRAAGWSPMRVTTTATPMHDDRGHVIGALAVVRDITRQHAVDQMRDDFLAMAAHELRTPVTAIKGYAQMAQSRLRALPPNELLQRALHTIDEQADRMSHLVGKLLDVTRIQNGSLELHCDSFDLIPLVRRGVEVTQARVSQHQLTLDAPPALIVHGDRERIAQVLANLLDNAVKYSPDGGLIDVRVVADAGTLRVGVRDQGVGIAHDKQAHIFEPGFQAQADTIGDYGGLGLSLSICREIIQRHGGDMWFEPRAEGGSMFSFALPLDTDQPV